MAPESSNQQTATRAASGQTVNVPAPASGEQQSVTSSPAGELVLGFDPSTATASRPEGSNDLVFTLDGGGTVTISDFFVVGDESLPNLQLPDGTVVASTDFFAGSDLDMTTAAGPAASAPPSSGSDGSGDPLDMTGGVDKLGDQGTWFWGRANEIDDEMVGNDYPGGGFGFGVVTEAGEHVMGRTVGVFEDGQAAQHLHGQQPGYDHPYFTPGVIEMSFQPNPVSSVGNIYFWNLPDGAKLLTMNSAGEYVEVPKNADGTYGPFSEGNFNGTLSAVYIVPPANSDADFNLNASVQFVGGGTSVTVNGVVQVIVDAVADRPDNLVGSVTDEGNDQHLASKNEDESKVFDDGFNKIETSVSIGEGEGSVPVSFAVKATFGDYLDGSEAHYILVAVDASNDITLRDPAGKYGDPVEVDGAMYFQVPVDAAIAEALASGQSQYTTADGYIVEFNPDGTVTVTAPVDLATPRIGSDTDFTVRTGALTQDESSDSSELDTTNNISWNTDDDGSRFTVTVDVVDSNLKVQMGWTSEGNAPEKDGKGTNLDTSKEFEQNQLDSTDPGKYDDPDSGAGLELATTGKGAPISISITGAADGSSPEHITEVTLDADLPTFGDGSVLGTFLINGTAIADLNDPYAIDNVTYTFDYDPADGTLTITISGPNAGLVTSLDDLNITFQPNSTPGTDAYYYDGDVEIDYTVTVQNDKGATGEYKGSGTVVIDAVADKSGDVTAKAAGTGTGDEGVADAVFTDTNAAHVNYNDQQQNGWIGDSFKSDNVVADYQLTVTVETQFKDLDGSEKHYVLVQDLSEADGPQWSVDVAALEALGYSYADTYEGSDGNTYFKIEVTDESIANSGNVSVEIPLIVTGVEDDDSFSIKTGSVAEETVTDDTSATSGIEYNKDDTGDQVFDGDRTDNNVAENLANAVDYKVDVVNAGLTVKAGWASEGNNDYSHMRGPSSGYVSDGQPGAGVGTGVGQATLENEQNANQGAPIEVALTDAGAGEQIASITVSHDGDGSLYLDGTLLTSTMNGEVVLFNGGNATVTYADGKYTITFPDSTTAITGNDLYYQPKDGSTNDNDVTLSYTVKVENGAGSTATFNGSTTVVIDAVANQPEVNIETDGSQVTYQNFGDTTTEQLAAKPGQNVTLKGNVTFDDVDGSEDHVIYVQKVAGVEYESITVGGNTYTAAQLATMVSTDVTSYVFNVDDTTPSFDVTIIANASPTKDTEYKITITGEATEKGYTGAPGYTGSTDHEYDTANNTSSKSGTVSFEVAPAEAAKVSVKSTYEDLNSTQHLGTTTTVPGSQITFSTSDTEGDEVLRGISITFEGELADYGTLVCETDTSYTISYDATTNTTTITFSTTNPNFGSTETVTFIPKEDSDKDFTFDYKVTTQDPESGHTRVTDSTEPGYGKQTAVVDAVADKPDTGFTDGNTDGKIDVTYGDGHDSARPGATVVLEDVTVKFGDYTDGSETHYLMVQRVDADTITSGNQYNTLPDQTLTMTGNGHTLVMVIVNGKIASLSVDGVAMGADSPYAGYLNTSISAHTVGSTTGYNDSLTDSNSYNNGDSANNGTYFKIPVPNEFLQLTDGEITTDITVGVPNTYTGDASFNIKVGGMALESGRDSGNVDLKNDAAYDFETATIKVGAVTSTPKFGVTDIYEDTDANAHLPTYDVNNPPSGMTLDAAGRNINDPNYVNDPARDHKGAEITVSGMNTSESARYFFIIKGEGGRDLDLGKHEPGDGMTITLNGVEYPVQYVAGIGYVAGEIVSGVFQPGIPVDGGSTGTTFVLDPGTDYNSEDLQIDWVVEITDTASGSQEIHTSLPAGADTNTTIGNLVDGYDPADTSNYERVVTDQPGMNVTVDAVAQRPDMELEGDANDGRIHSDGQVIADADKGTAVDLNNDGRYDFVEAKAGQPVYISATVEFKDVYDGSERHYFLVEAKAGWTPPTSIILYDADGNVAGEIPITSVAKQSYDGTLYYKFEISNEDILEYDIDPAALGGQLHVEFVLTSPPNPQDTTFKVGAMSWEDYAQLGTASGQNNELILNSQTVMQNNTAHNIVEDAVHVQFAKVGGLTLTPKNSVFENNTPFANQDDPDQPGYQPLQTEGSPAEISVNLGGDDKVIDFTITNIDEINEAGTLVYTEGGVTYQIDASGHIVDDQGNTRLPSNSGQFEFTPGHNYSDADVDIRFSGTVQSNKTGATNDVTGSAHVTVDAVAQMPSGATAVDRSGDDTPNVVELVHSTKTGEGADNYQVAKITVSAVFSDFVDGSEAHYVLVQALPNTAFMDGDGKIFTYELFYAEDGHAYYKIPVDNAELKNGDGTISLDLDMVFYSRMQGLGHTQDTLRIGALAVEENLSDTGEITYDNNVAFMQDGDLTIEHTWPGGHVIWVDPAYENNTPIADQDDPNAPGTQANETPAGGGEIHWGAVPYTEGGVELLDPITTVDLKWNSEAGKIVVVKDGQVVEEHTNGPITLDLADGTMYFVPNPNYKDADTGLTYTAHGEGGHDAIGAFPIIIDAVAQMPEFDYTVDGSGNKIYDTASHVDYGNDGQGNDYSAMGAAGNQGNEGTCTITIGGVFQDTVNAPTDTQDYALLEARPGMQVISPASPETIYLDGKLYYKFPVTPDQDGKGTVDVTIKLDNPQEGTVTLQTGLLSEEPVIGAPGNWESDIDNNLSWNLDGTAEVTVSLVNSSMHVSAGDGYEDGLVNVTISGKLGANDEFNGFTLSHNGEGQFVVTDSNGVGGWHIDSDGNLVITDFDAVGKIQVQYKPAAESGDDVTWSWKAKFTDTLSGDKASPSGGGTIVIDAVATDDVHAKDAGSESDSGHTLSASGKEAVVSVTLTFDDLDGSETHYAVIEQDARWPLTSVTINGETYTLPSSEITVTTIHSDAGKPYHAVVIDDALLKSLGGSVDVEFTLQAPTSSTDFRHKLSVGGITVEEADGTGGDKELNLSNNWGESLQDVTVGVAEVQATTIKVAADQPSMEEDGGMMKINFSVTDGNNDSIKEVTIKAPAGGKLVDADGNEYPVSGGSVILSASDLENVYFQPNENWSGTVTLDITGGTLIDNASGAEKNATTLTDGSFTVLGVADAPGNVGASSAPVEDTHSVTVTLEATFPDTDGEGHYFLVKAPTGLTLEGYAEANADEVAAAGGTAGETWYKIPASSNAEANVSEEITLTAQPDYTGGNLTYVAVAEETGAAAGGKKYAASDGQTLAMPDPSMLNTAPAGAEVEVTAVLSALGAMHGTLDPAVMFADAEGDSITPTSVSFGTGDPVDLNPSGSVSIDGDHGKLTVTGDGHGNYTYDYALNPGEDVSKGDADIFKFGGEDGYGGSTALGKEGTLAITFDERHVMADGQGSLINESTDTGGVVIHGHPTIGAEITGGSGDDIIHVGSGTDILVGGDGADLFVWDVANFGGDDVIEDFSYNAETNSSIDHIGLSNLFANTEELDTLLGSIPDIDGRSFSYSSIDGNSIKAEFLSENQLQLTLTHENQTQNITINADDGGFYNPESQTLDAGLAQDILTNILKTYND